MLESFDMVRGRIALKTPSILLAAGCLLAVSASGAGLNLSSTTVTLGDAVCNASQVVTVTSDAPTAFAVSVNYPNGTSNGDAHGNWLFVHPAYGGFTSTGATIESSADPNGIALSIGLNINLGAVSDYGTVVVTPAGGAPIDIVVFYRQNSVCGSSDSLTNNFITVTPGNEQWTGPFGSQRPSRARSSRWGWSSFAGAISGRSGPSCRKNDFALGER